MYNFKLEVILILSSFHNTNDISNNSLLLLLYLINVRYTGTNPDDAGRLLDESQGVSGVGWPAKGHPRNHAASGNLTDGVESYSRGGRKTGFLSKEDQNLVMHHALITRHAQRAMEILSEGDTRVAITLPVNRLNLNQKLPIGRWSNGNLTEQGPMRALTFLLQRYEMVDDPQIFTCYPRLEDVRSSVVNIVRRQFGTHGPPIEIPAQR